MKIRSVEAIGRYRYDDNTSSYLAEALNRQTAMDAVIHAHKSGLIGAATFAKLVRVCDPNDQLDQLAEYIGYTGTTVRMWLRAVIHHMTARSAYKSLWTKIFEAQKIQLLNER